MLFYAIFRKVDFFSFLHETLSLSNKIRHFLLKNLQKLHLKKLIYKTYLCLKTLFVTYFTPKTNGHLIQTS